MTATIIELHPKAGYVPMPRATPNAEGAALAELRRARIRIAQLEASLTQAMRDSLVNFNRARAAERRLEDLTG